MKISEALGNDHSYLDQLYYNLKAASTPADQIKWRNALTWNLARHAISEELTVYPAMEKFLGAEGKALAAEDFEQHQAVKEDLHKLQSLPPTSPDFFPLLETLMTDLHTHIEHEKNHDMPRLESVLPYGESEKIALAFARTKKFVPTKSHPSAPTSSLLAEGLAGLLTAPFDKLRDLLSSFPDEGATEGTEVDWKGKL